MGGLRIEIGTYEKFLREKEQNSISLKSILLYCSGQVSSGIEIKSMISGFIKRIFTSCNCLCFKTNIYFLNKKKQ